MRVLAALEVRERRTERICRRWQKQERHTLPTCRERVSSWSRVTLRSRTVVENRTPGKRSSKMERSILDNCTRPPTQMNCVFPGFNKKQESKERLNAAAGRDPFHSTLEFLPSIFHCVLKSVSVN